MIQAKLVRRTIDVAQLIASAASPDAGATSVFIGTVRNHNDGQSVNGIDYSAYETMAESELTRIVNEAAQKHAVLTILVEHRIGKLEVGEISIAIVTASARRAAALECTSDLIEEIKKRVPIWKLEHYADGTREWVDPTSQESGAIL